jgi:formyl-CoA transferase
MLADPHTKARGIVLDYDHPALGPMKTVAQPVLFNGQSRSVVTAPPLHGQHTRQILLAAGFSTEEIQAMIEAAVVV